MVSERACGFSIPVDISNIPGEASEKYELLGTVRRKILV